jgi:hypothetical protein
MIYHVLPGDAVAIEFSKSKIGGDAIICRECLVVGPADAETYFEFWEQRARFILAEYGGDEIVYHETVADELAKLLDLPADSEVNLWFEYELFCSVNMWFCLSLLAETQATLFRVEPILLSPENRWKGFGSMISDDLQKCFEARSKFDPADIKLGSDLWDAFRNRDFDRLRQLGETRSERFPYLEEVCNAAAEIETKPKEILREIIASGTKEISDAFPEFVRRAGVYGFGDAQVERILTTL